MHSKYKPKNISSQMFNSLLISRARINPRPAIEIKLHFDSPLPFLLQPPKMNHNTPTPSPVRLAAFTPNIRTSQDVSCSIKYSPTGGVFES